MFSPPSLTVLRCSDKKELAKEIEVKLPALYEDRYFGAPECFVSEEEENVVFVKNRFDCDVSPKRHPCDKGTLEHYFLS